jgi:hypothetical protein
MLELSHKKLIAWQKSIELMPVLYGLCSKLPKEEIYSRGSNEKSGTLYIE